MQGAVDAMLDRYPEATLQDVYKSMFQDRFGVAHMLASPERVCAYVEREVAECTGAATDYYESCGWRGRFVRVDLRAVRDGLITAEELTDSFVRSAAYCAEPDSVALAAWHREWTTIVERCYPRLKGLDGFEQDSVALEELMRRGEYVVHHSRQFNSAYAPHYRIVHRRLLPNAE